MEFNSPMARQFNGPVIDSLLNARHNIFNDSEEFMLHRQGLTLENATTEELNLIGKFLCMARPYAMVDGEPEYCDDAFYRIYIQNLAILRQSQSIYDLARMFDQFMPDGRYFVAFLPDGDLLVVIDEQYNTYVPFFQKALNSVFTSLPRINTLESWDFDKFVYQHRLYTRLISLKNSDWEFGVITTQLVYEYLVVGTNRTVYVSRDLINWTQRIIPGIEGSIQFKDAVYAEHKWVIVGTKGVIFVSEDTETWTQIPSGVTVDLNAIAYGDGKWVVVGASGTILVSSDLAVWNSYLAYESGYPVDYRDYYTILYEQGTWIGTGGSGTFISSIDTTNWNATVPGQAYGTDIRSVLKVDGELSAFGGFAHFTSVDGVTWEQQTNIQKSARAVTYGNNSYLLLTPSSYNAGRYVARVFSSSDLVEWNLCYEKVSDNPVLLDVTCKEDKYFIVGGTSIDATHNEGQLFISEDLSNWTIVSLGTANALANRMRFRKVSDVGTKATVVSPSGKLTVNNHIATATIERRT